MEAKVLSFRELYRKHFVDNEPTKFLILWHYTNADGLCGIIRNRPDELGKLHFWFTRSDCLNDTSEGIHILSTYQKVCTDLLNEGRIGAEFYNRIIDEDVPTSQFVNFPIPSKEDFTHESVLDCVPCDAYICSFSLKEDSLDMWRYYSKGNSGYGLKCYSLLFDEYKEYEYSNYDEEAVFSMIRSYPVIYDNTQKEKILKEIVIDTFSAYESSNDPESEKMSDALGFIRYALKNFQFQFKHECYSSEQEYRFVFYLPKDKPALLENKLPDVKFRTQNGILVPYLDVVVERGSSYLEEILISPFIESPSVQTTTTDYLQQCKFKGKVRISDLPVRK